MAQPLEFEQAGYNSPGGLQIGRTSTDLVAFYGATPVVKASTVSTSMVSSATSVSLSTNGTATTSWGFATQVELTNMVTAVSTMQWALKQMGIIG